jgi:hypothetical protein
VAVVGQLDIMVAVNSARLPVHGTEEEKGDSDDAVVMAVTFAKKRLGVATYFSGSGRLSVAEAATKHDDMSILQLFKYQFRPTHIIAPSRSDVSVCIAQSDSQTVTSWASMHRNV